jgi:CBS domain-containing protein
MTPPRPAPDLRVRSIMRTQIVTVPPEATVRELLRILADESLNGAPVVGGDGRLAGVVSAGDVLRRLRGVAPDPRGTDAAYFFADDSYAPPALQALQGLDSERLDRRVRDVLLPAAYRVDPESTVGALGDFFLRTRATRALVTQGDRLRGIVTPADVLRAGPRIAPAAAAMP